MPLQQLMDMRDLPMNFEFVYYQPYRHNATAYHAAAVGNMRSGTGDQLLPADGSAITMEGRYFEGTTVVFNKDTAKLESVGGSTTNLGINAAFHS